MYTNQPCGGVASRIELIMYCSHLDITPWCHHLDNTMDRGLNEASTRHCNFGSLDPRLTRYWRGISIMVLCMANLRCLYSVDWYTCTVLRNHSWLHNASEPKWLAVEFVVIAWKIFHVFWSRIVTLANISQFKINGNIWKYVLYWKCKTCHKFNLIK